MNMHTLIESQNPRKSFVSLNGYNPSPKQYNGIAEQNIFSCGWNKLFEGESVLCCDDPYILASPT